MSFLDAHSHHLDLKRTTLSKKTINDIRCLSRLGVAPHKAVRQIQQSCPEYSRDYFVDLKDIANHSVKDVRTRLHSNDDTSMQLNVATNRSLGEDERFIMVSLFLHKTLIRLTSHCDTLITLCRCILDGVLWRAI